MTAWLVAQTELQREQVAVKWLKEQRFHVYLPCIRIETVMHQRKVERLAPLFPSYVFVQRVEHWQPIVRTIGVIDVLYSGERPAQLGDEVIAGLRARERDGVIALPTRPDFQRGDSVRVVRGPFQGQIAIFQDMKPKDRIEVLLSILGAERQLELARRDVLRVK